VLVSIRLAGPTIGLVNFVRYFSVKRRRRRISPLKSIEQGLIWPLKKGEIIEQGQKNGLNQTELSNKREIIEQGRNDLPWESKRVLFDNSRILLNTFLPCSII
jgi:hypothetical protein